MKHNLINDNPESGWIPAKFKPQVFSVIVPTYNRAHTIVESLDSVWQQSYRPIEVVIVDDGSTDDTKQVLDNWMQTHPDSAEFICTRIWQENGGVCAARNLALKNSTGQYIQFLDSDDTIYPERLARIAKIFCESNYDYVETGFEGFHSNPRRILETHFGHVGRNQLELLLRGQLWPNTLRPAYTRQLINRIGPWNEAMITFQDLEYVTRALTLNPPPKCGAIEDILASARRDTTGRMSNIFKTWEGRNLRIHCEDVLFRRIRNREDIPLEWKMQFASRLYGLCLRSSASGWPDLSKRCAKIAASLNVKLDALGRRRRFVWKCGRLVSMLYCLPESIRACSSRAQ